jgi:hypothetical protein
VEEKSLLRQQQTLNDNLQYYRDDDGDEYEDRYGLIRESPYNDRQQEEKEEKNFDSRSDNTPVLEKKFRDSTNTKSNSYRDVTSSVNYPNKNSKTSSQWQHQSFSDLPGRGRRAGGMQGFGNCDPRRDAMSSSNKSDGFGSFFKRLYDRQQESQTMRIATEDTMEEPTWTENLGRVAAVLIAPELCDDPDEDLDRLAMYRSIGSDVDDDDDEQGGDQKQEWTGAKPNEAALWKTEVQRLKGYVEKLENELKAREMEAVSWKQRAKELEQELRKVTGKGDEDSTENKDSDSEEEETEEDDHPAVEGDLLGIASDNNITEPSNLPSPSDRDLSKEKTEAIHLLVLNVEKQQLPRLLLTDAEDATKSKLTAFDPLGVDDTHQLLMAQEHDTLALIPSKSISQNMLEAAS